MELNEALAKIASQDTALSALRGEKDRMSVKMSDLLNETKEAKTARNGFKDQLAALTTEFGDFKNNASLGEENMQKVNDLVSSKMEAITAGFETTIDELTASLTEAQGSYGKLKGQYDGERISGAIRKSAEKAGVLPGAIDDVVLRSGGVFSVAENGSIEARDADGNLMKSGKKLMSPDVFVEGLKDTAAHFWPGSQASGANGAKGAAGSKVNPFSKDTLSYTEQAKMMRSDPDLANRMKAEAQG